MSAAYFHSSPERIRVGDSSGSGLNQVPEDEELALDWEEEEEMLLEEQGFYKGSYPRLVALYTLAPLTALTAFALLAGLPYVAYRCPEHHTPTYPYPALLPSPLPEILASVALYSLSHLLRSPIYTLAALIIPFPLPATLLSTTLHTALSTFARLAALTLLLIRPHAVYTYPTWHDGAVPPRLDAVTGRAARATPGLALYRDVLVLPSPPTTQMRATDSTHTERTPLLTSHLPDPDPDTELDYDLEQLVALKAREELEDVFGLPLIRIPAFIPCLQRVNSILLSLGLFLLLGASLYRNPTPLVALAAATHLLLAVLHAPIVLPRVGVQGAAYVGAVVSLGAFFAGLGVWGGVS
ncbi:hypothetical protein C8R46DRAFT_1285071 [Mycena filopes]|nr:hypothetical protein C8R46DRAFT_1285071 [Mycena filopes]